MSNKLVKRKTEKEENIGIKFYISCGKVFVGCGVVCCLLLGFVSTLPQDYEKYNIPLFFGIWFIISFAMLIFGLVLITLCKKSKKFQTWAEKDVLNFTEHFIHKKR
ncbi:MAG: hypothetical protein K2H31_03035 [Lachnospiraceae bacterium]|nr:hypothetical protein [Lachnospiraceae bacterium]